MSWLFGSSKSEPKDRLPNGDLAPIVCPVCLSEKTTCTCPVVTVEAVTTAKPTSSASTAVYVSPSSVTMSTSSKTGTLTTISTTTTTTTTTTKKIKDSSPKAISNAPCLQCGNEMEKCVCPEVVEPRETGIRSRTPIPDRIKKMLDFCDELHELLNLGHLDQEAHQALMQRGEDLQKQHDCLAKNMQRGVVTGEMMKKHLAEVDKFMKECDAKNAKLCEHGSLFLEQLPEPVTTAITNTTVVSTASRSEDTW